MQIDIKKEIRNYRNNANLSQERFGKRYGRSGGAVSTWESGRSYPPILVFLDVLNWVYNTKMEIK